MLCGFSRNCIPELGGEGLDAISGRTMYRAGYHNFGDHEAIDDQPDRQRRGER